MAAVVCGAVTYAIKESAHDVGGAAGAEEVTMKRTYVPSRGVKDWRWLLAKPEKHWRKGYSARALAHCWEEADGFPPEIARLLSGSGIAALDDVKLLLAFPEYVTPLRGKGKSSHSDVFVLGKGADGGLVSVMVEGKVAEPFGETMNQWTAGMSDNKGIRLEYLKEILGLSGQIPGEIRYQLVHRTASAVIEAKRFNAQYAVMVVHSFSKEDEGFGDCAAFAGLFGAEVRVGRLVHLNETNGIDLYCGWARGDGRFLKM
jgi:hypothetical protein